MLIWRVRSVPTKIWYDVQYVCCSHEDSSTPIRTALILYVSPRTTIRGNILCSELERHSFGSWLVMFFICFWQDCFGDFDISQGSYANHNWPCCHFAYTRTKLALAFFHIHSSYQRLMSLLLENWQSILPLPSLSVGTWDMLPSRFDYKIAVQPSCPRTSLTILPKTKEHGIWKLPVQSSSSCFLPGSDSSLRYRYNDGHYELR